MTKNDIIDIIFNEFTIEPEYILSEETNDSIIEFRLKDEENTEATLTINFDNNGSVIYTIECMDYKEEKEFIFLPEL